MSWAASPVLVADAISATTLRRVAISASVDAGRRHAGDHAFERGAGERHLLRLRGVEGHPHAAARLGDDQPLVLQPPERLLERRRADAELARPSGARSATRPEGISPLMIARRRRSWTCSRRPFRRAGIDRIQPRACNVRARVLLRGLASRRAPQCAGLRRTYWDRSATCGLVETPAECFLPCLVRLVPKRGCRTDMPLDISNVTKSKTAVDRRTCRKCPMRIDHAGYHAPHRCPARHGRRPALGSREQALYFVDIARPLLYRLDVTSHALRTLGDAERDRQFRPRAGRAGPSWR